MNYVRVEYLEKKEMVKFQSDENITYESFLKSGMCLATEELVQLLRNTFHNFVVICVCSCNGV